MEGSRLLCEYARISNMPCHNFLPKLILLTCAVFSFTLEGQTILIQASTMLDGKGGVLRDATLVIDGSVIKAVRTGADRTPVTYDLHGLTLMPGWIDTHVHMNYYMDANGRAHTGSGAAPADALYGAGNAYADLEAGFTTVQSIGAASDKPLRDLLSRGVIPGSRLLTSLTPITEKSGSPDEIKVLVQRLVADGADVIKLFATKSSREGGGQTMNDAQLQAACGEANRLGKRSMVHAHASGGAKAAVLAGCTTIEHGSTLDDETLDLIASRGIYFDPNISTTYHYLANKKAFLGQGNYTEEGFAFMEKALPMRYDVIRRALARHIKITFGTDAVSGAHGRNAEEFIYRVQNAHIPPSDAIISATSRAAESMRMADTIGSIGAGMQADLVATDGNPLEDITAVRRVVFVMKGGRVYKFNPPAKTSTALSSSRTAH
jgi:imidazolonepropionase-like amidohydrolase